MLRVLCIDVGNTSAHLGLFENARLLRTRQLETRTLESSLRPLMNLPDWTADCFAYCSVVPEATRAVGSILSGNATHLCAETPSGLRITYPNPKEIGEDRLANALGAQRLTDSSAIVIDMGTATTFDIVTPEEGYIGGIIAPGLSLMTRYLHEQTALLPMLQPGELIEPEFAIGRSTEEAMTIGCTVGFSGMIAALLERVTESLRHRTRFWPTVFLTGGSAPFLNRGFFRHWRHEPSLTLLGLLEAAERNHVG